jgi:hypothetical protein
MIFLLLSISRTNLNPSSLVELVNSESSSVWQEGEPYKSGHKRFHRDSGLSVAYPEEASWISALPKVESILVQQSTLLKAAADMECTIELSIGVTVGSAESFAPSMELPVSLLSALAAAKVSVTITAYPTSDE